MASPPRRWNMDIEEWLRGLGLQHYATAFRENNVETEVLPWLTAEEPQGHWRNLGRASTQAAGGDRRAADRT